MNRLIACLQCLGILAACTPLLAQTAESRPNVIFILADDLGYSDLSCYGATRVKTPHIDQLAAGGYRFTDFHTAASICSPSRAAFLTGSYPQRCGLYMGINPLRTAHWFLGLHPDEVTLAEQFKDQGYQTLLVGKWHLGTEPEFSPLNQGFDDYYGMPCNYHHSPRFFDGEKEVFARSPLERLTELYTQRMKSFIRQKGTRPFFIYYSHNYPHTPFKPGKKFAGTSADGIRGDVIQEFDWSVGELIKTLEETGVARNTIVIFTSDNGPTNNRYAQPFRGTKYVSFEGGHRVPFIFHWPARITKGKVSDVSINAMDLFPTLSDIIAAPMPSDRVYDGANLLPLLDGKELSRPATEPFYYYNCENLQAIRRGHWKLHLPRQQEQLPFWDRNKAFRSLSSPVLYNLRSDQGESRDAAAEQPEVVQQMLELAAQARKELGEYLQRGSGQRPTGSIFPDVPVISHPKDWDRISAAVQEMMDKQRQKRHPDVRIRTGKKTARSKLSGGLGYVPISFISANDVPQSVEQTWADFDPRAEPLETQLIRESTEDGIVLRHVRYVVGTFGGKKTSVAGFFAFPADGKQLPGIVQLHGGGQRALPETARFWASHGYAAIAVNWGEHVIGEKDDPNTDWAGIPAGFLDPKHHNGVTPAEGTIHDIPHPWNSSWLLYSAAARRAITFLEEQPEADGSNVGLTGHSMGGRLTVLTAIDPRVKAASPSVGGSGYLYSNITGVPGSARHMLADLELYNATLDCRNYWPLIRCPVMFLGATNDFNSPMELVLRGFRSLPQRNGAMSFTPHMNHRFTADNYAARVRWFETHLKGTFDFPETATARLDLKREADPNGSSPPPARRDGGREGRVKGGESLPAARLKPDDAVPRFTVRPDLSGPHKLKSVAVFYGYDRDPRARFWRSAGVVRHGDSFVAACPVMELGEPLFVFANVTYDTGTPLKMPRGYADTPLLTITSECRHAFPHQLVEAGVKPSGVRQRLIEDFRHGWRDWSLVGIGHTTHWNYETHKVNDPAFVGPRGASLALDMETTAPNNTLAVVLDVDRWRGYTGRKPRRFTALVELPDAGLHSLKIPVDKFVTPEGEVLENYDFVTSLILTPGQKECPDKVTEVWQGKVPIFKNIRWEGGDFAARPRPYLKSE